MQSTRFQGYRDKRVPKTILYNVPSIHSYLNEQTQAHSVMGMTREVHLFYDDWRAKSSCRNNSEKQSSREQHRKALG